eukprot:TRINITY_DN12681_c0_g2_i1.p1 TRINITY_DN12681_c0_g2~~TRINITY_DN12681_c0_g2_i1.p1  ORF type:complete len:387 (-),score=74.18 TRINITY_DN12681_c0_g2_i1:53-1213(-)
MPMVDLPAVAPIVVQQEWLSRWSEIAICISAALVVLRVELQRRAGDSTGLGGGSIACCKKIITQCAPEIAGVIGCLTLAALLRARGDSDPLDPSQAQVWDAIKSQWPLLVTADTLLALQSMLRVCILVSSMLRASSASLPVPLADEAATLCLGAQVMRFIAAAMDSSFKLDGPLGGTFPVGCDAIAVILLVGLGGLRVFRRNPIASSVTVCCIGWLAGRHHLCMANEVHLDQFFVGAYMLDVFASLTYFGRSLLIGGSESVYAGRMSVGFTHVLMATQQGLATYYFFVAFDFQENLVGNGLPFSVLKLGNAVAFCAYLASATLWIAELAAGDASDRAAVHTSTADGRQEHSPAVALGRGVGDVSAAPARVSPSAEPPSPSAESIEL